MEHAGRGGAVQRSNADQEMADRQTLIQFPGKRNFPHQGYQHGAKVKLCCPRVYHQPSPHRWLQI